MTHELHDVDSAKHAKTSFAAATPLLARVAFGNKTLQDAFKDQNVRWKT